MIGTIALNIQILHVFTFPSTLSDLFLRATNSCTVDLGGKPQAVQGLVDVPRHR